jgi:hypothetical protein
MAKSPEKPPFSIVSGTAGPVPPPRPLGQHGSALWQRVQSEYRITDVGGAEILSQICSAADRVESLRAAIDRDGETIFTKSGPKAHPALRDETQLRAFIVRGIEKLGLNFEAIKPSGRPPGGGLGWTR